MSNVSKFHMKDGYLYRTDIHGTEMVPFSGSVNAENASMAFKNGVLVGVSTVEEETPPTTLGNGGSIGYQSDGSYVSRIPQLEKKYGKQVEAEGTIAMEESKA